MNKQNRFLPTTKDEMKQRGWDELDVVLITGDAYIDSPFMGIAVVGRILEDIGLRVGIIGQPDINSDVDIKRLGEPKLFWGVSGGSIDSMVSNYTATKKFRNDDDYTPGGKNNKRPDRIRRYFKNTAPIVLGGIEASLRRLTHYDYWSNTLRKPILFDSKADYMIYGMGEQAIIDLGLYLKEGKDVRTIAGLCYISKEPVKEYLQIPSHKECLENKEKYIDLFRAFYDNNDPMYSKGLCQEVDGRFLIQNPPSRYLEENEMDKIASYPYQRDLHPYHAKDGKVKALETIKFSIMTHHGCWGECNYCAIAAHQGRTIRTRSEENILSEAKHFTTLKDFKGIISDVGGPTANMYGYECKLCRTMKVDHSRNIKLLKDIRAIPKVKKAFIASDEVLHHMGKPGKQSLIEFKKMFDDLNKESGKKQFLTYYLIAAHPGCKESHMHELKQFTTHELKINPEQAQVFTPTPGTYSAVMYYTELDPFTKKKIFVEKDTLRKERQKEIVVAKKSFCKTKQNSSSGMQG